MPRLSLIVKLLLLLTPYAAAQNAQIDSLRELARSPSYSRAYADALNELSSALFNYNIAEANALADSAYNTAKQANYPEGMRYALILKGFQQYAYGNYDEAMRIFRQSSSLVKNQRDDLEAYNLTMIANVYLARAQYDSAKLLYEESIDLELRLNSDRYLAYAYKNLARLYLLQWKNSEAEKYFLKAIELYKKKNNLRAIADTWFSLADVYRNLTDLTSADKLVSDACVAGQKLNDEFLQLYCEISTAEIDFNRGVYSEAQQHLFSALKKIERLDLPNVLTRIYIDLGDVSEAQGQNDLALKYFFDALKIAERIGIKHEIANIYSSIAWIYKNQHNFLLAHSYINRSLSLRNQINDQHGISNSYNVMGVILLEERKYDSALIMLDKALDIRKKINHRLGISASIYNKALVLEEQKKFDEALKLQMEALAIEESIGNSFGLGISYNSIGNLFILLKRTTEAEVWLNKARRLAESTGSRTMRMHNHKLWSAYCEAIGDYKNGLEYHKRYTALKDSIFDEMSAAKVAEFQALYQIEEKNREIKQLNQQKELQSAEISLQRSRINLQNAIILSIIIGLFLVSLLTYKTWQYNEKMRKAHREILEQKEEIQSQSEELIEANTTIADINKELETKIEQRTHALARAYKELDTFFYRASHDFRRPLTTFLGLAEVANVTVKDPNALELFDKVKSTALNLDKMLVKLQSISDVGSQELIFKEVFVKEIFDSVSDNFREELIKKNINATCEVTLSTPFVSYPAMVKIIIENLFENAIHFSGYEGPYIKIHVTESGRYVNLDVQDNGQGIPKQYHEQIFDMYFRASERSKGNGLGLYIVKKAVEKLDGVITVSSIAGAGSTFSIMLPNHHVS
jgi:signal transduction histidine kinase/tetratricopeptide (TPR) repeat protein